MPRPHSSRDSLLINLNSCKYDALREVAERMGYEVAEEEEENWDLCWSDLSVSIERVQKLKSFQRLNHFPSMLEICRKAALSRHVARMAARLGDEYGFYPTSLVLPDQLDDFIHMLRRNTARIDAGTGPVSTYILKPSGGTMGRGITLVQTLGQLQDAIEWAGTSSSSSGSGAGSSTGGSSSGGWGCLVAQQYVANPLLLDGYKFDLRIYALVLSVDPLKIYLYDEGLARLATQPYQRPTSDNMDVSTMHLTNYSVNKHASGFVSSDTSGTGTKRLASAVLQQVADQAGCSKQTLVDGIRDIVVKTVLSIQPLLAHTYHTALPAKSHSTSQPGSHCPTCSLDHSPIGEDRPSGSAPSSHTKHSRSSSSSSNMPSCDVDGSQQWAATSCDCPPSQCFEVLGFDIMFDDSLNPWLLEVNHSPSFSCDARIDKQVKSALLLDTLAALRQQREAKAQFMAQQQKAINERLYSPQTTMPVIFCDYCGLTRSKWHDPVVRRPLSAIPKSKQLQAAAAALDEITSDRMTSSTSASTSTRPHTYYGAPGAGSNTSGNADRPDSGSSCSSSTTHSHSQPVNSLGTMEIDGSYGLMNGASAWTGDGSPGPQIGRYHQIYPPRETELRKKYRHIMQVAADAFPDQRCQCAWCARRREWRLLQSGLRDCGFTARPYTACSPLLPRGGSANGRMFQTASRPSSQQQQRQVVASVVAAAAAAAAAMDSPDIAARLPPRPATSSAALGSTPSRRRCSVADSVSSHPGSETCLEIAGEDGPSPTCKASRQISRYLDSLQATASATSSPTGPQLPAPVPLPSHTSDYPRSTNTHQQPPRSTTPPRSPSRGHSRGSTTESRFMAWAQPSPSRNGRTSAPVVHTQHHHEAQQQQQSGNASSLFQRSTSWGPATGCAKELAGPSPSLPLSAAPSLMRPGTAPVPGIKAQVQLHRSSSTNIGTASAAYGMTSTPSKGNNGPPVGSAGTGSSTNTTTNSEAAGSSNCSTSSPGCKVPRVALLGAKKSTSRGHSSGSALECELMAMRLRTASLLSNRFVSIYLTKQPVKGIGSSNSSSSSSNAGGGSLKRSKSVPRSRSASVV